MTAINTAITEIGNIPAGTDTDETLAVIQAYHDLSFAETYKLNAQIDPAKPYAPQYLSPEFTAAAIAALIASEQYLHVWGTDEKPHTAVQQALRATGRRLVDNGSRRLWLTYDVWVVALSEQMEHYNFPAELAGKVESVESVYFFDRNTATHLCSFDASYWCEYLETRGTLKDEYADDDELRESLADFLMDANVDTKADYFGDRQIDRIIKANKPGTVYHYGNPQVDLNEARDEVLGKLEQEHASYRASAKMPPLTPTALTAHIVEGWSEEAIGEQVGQHVMDAVREALQSNSVL